MKAVVKYIIKLLNKPDQNEDSTEETTMKFSNATKLVSAGVLALSLSTLPMVHSASAQDATGATGTTDTTGDTTPTADVESNDGFDWGWLGLLGLAGLAGLKKRDDEPVRYREPETTRTGTGYRE